MQYLPIIGDQVASPLGVVRLVQVFRRTADRAISHAFWIISRSDKTIQADIANAIDQRAAS